MEFSIIYSIDCPRDKSIRQFNPPSKQKRLWQLTEADSRYDCGDLEGRWSKGKHRKWCALLNREQFEAFLRHTRLCAQDVRTMGSIGAPGCGFGLAPAFSFDNDNPDAIQNAYVTPLATRTEIAEFLKAVNEEHEADLPIPRVLTDSEDQTYMFDGPGNEWSAVERSIRKALCIVY